MSSTALRTILLAFKVEHHNLLRAIDALMDNVDRVEVKLAKQIGPLVDRDLTVVFYDLTTVRIHGEGEVDDDIRAYGMNKETGGIARQFVFGVVQTAQGLPLMHIGPQMQRESFVKSELSISHFSLKESPVC